MKVKNVGGRPQVRARDSGYFGVRWNDLCRKWQACIHDRKRKRLKYLGVFDDPVEAALAYDQGVKELFQSQMKINFPNGLPENPHRPHPPEREYKSAQLKRLDNGGGNADVVRNINKARSLVGVEPMVIKTRSCLRCDKEFISYGFSNRMCDSCDQIHKGYADYGIKSYGPAR